MCLPCAALHQVIVCGHECCGLKYLEERGHDHVTKLCSSCKFSWFQVEWVPGTIAMLRLNLFLCFCYLKIAPSLSCLPFPKAEESMQSALGLGSQWVQDNSDIAETLESAVNKTGGHHEVDPWESHIGIGWMWPPWCCKSKKSVLANIEPCQGLSTCTVQSDILCNPWEQQSKFHPKLLKMFWLGNHNIMQMGLLDLQYSCIWQLLLHNKFGLTVNNADVLDASQSTFLHVLWVSF